MHWTVHGIWYWYLKPPFKRLINTITNRQILNTDYQTTSYALVFVGAFCSSIARIYFNCGARRCAYYEVVRLARAATPARQAVGKLVTGRQLPGIRRGLVGQGALSVSPCSAFHGRAARAISERHDQLGGNSFLSLETPSSVSALPAGSGANGSAPARDRGGARHWISRDRPCKRPSYAVDPVQKEGESCRKRSGLSNS